MSAIETARETLLSQLEPLERDYTEAKEKLDAIEQEKDKIEAALKALGGSKKGKAKAGRKPSKPFARKQDVMTVCLALVEANQPIAKDDLESRAKHKLAEDSGFSLSGVSLRLSECLGSDAFTVTADGTITLAVAAKRVV